MNYNNPKPQRSTRTILFVALALIALAGIIYMKYATDSRKADAVKGSLEGPVTNMCPGSLLQLHPDCGVFLDPPAAAKLTK